MRDLRVRAATAADRAAITDLLVSSWGGTTVVGHGTVYDAARLPALVAEREGVLAGLLTYTVADGGLEVVTVDAARRLKPSIPRTGDHGIPLHDELTLELVL
ncbi:hypothetical protein [Streptomyces sp.]|uniref:hypothetical protein n=1 Tax=Streptomyces sp. TaxID=1931 RepID=UPI002811CCDA|nr:hypothetical protein [Streptomyces sp.]